MNFLLFYFFFFFFLSSQFSVLSTLLLTTNIFSFWYISSSTSSHNPTKSSLLSHLRTLEVAQETSRVQRPAPVNLTSPLSSLSTNISIFFLEGYHIGAHQSRSLTTSPLSSLTSPPPNTQLHTLPLTLAEHSTFT